MRQELQDKLLARFPKMFRHLVEGQTEAISPLSQRGIECGDGWYELVFELTKKLEKLIENIPVEECPACSQCKEKFASMRYYVDWAPDSDTYEKIGKEFNEYVHKYEAKSAVTCEDCGAPAKQSCPRYYMLILCDACLKKNEEQRVT
jgi:hypothetical protein